MERNLIRKSITDFLNGVWLTNEGPTKVRCDAYKEQLNEANEQIKREDISKKNKRYYKKEKKRAMDGLHKVDVENKEFITKVICGVGFTFLSFATAVAAIKKHQIPNKKLY